MKVAVEDVRFDERGLVPAIVQDAKTGEVLTLAYMNSESLQRTLANKQTWFWSRSRQQLWHKGETSGNTQHVVDVRLDCDKDALIVSVEPSGPACHTGSRTCFHYEVAEATGRHSTEVSHDTDNGGGGDGGGGGDRQNIDNSDGTRNTLMPNENHELSESKSDNLELSKPELGTLLNDLYALIEERRESRPEGSYTTYLFDKGLDKILKKVGEEAAETIIAAKNAEAAPLVAETADLIYHLLVLLVERGITLEQVQAELAVRRTSSTSASH